MRILVYTALFDDKTIAWINGNIFSILNDHEFYYITDEKSDLKKYNDWNLSYIPKLKTRFKIINKIYDFLILPLKIANFMKKKRIQLMLIPSESWSDIIGNFAGRIYRIPVISYLRGHILIIKKLFSKSLFLKVANKLHIFGFKMFDKIIAITDELKQYITSYGIKKSKVSVIYCATNDELFFPSTEKFENLSIIHTGGFFRDKGIHFILELARKFPEIDFLLAGMGKPDLFGSIPCNCKILGWKSKPELAKLLRKSHIFLFLTYSEGFSIALLDAMTSGLAIITTNVDHHKYLVKGGYILPSPALVEEKVIIKESSKAIKDLKESPKKIEEFGKKNYDFSRNFNLEKQRKKYNKLFYDEIKNLC
ncbi:MAG: glycosyltransferase [Candidatus Lokiarchaeota archaeon]|nr:glycosyltransferase [Candidatus Lokiarchaeota archaeon]